MLIITNGSVKENKICDKVLEIKKPVPLITTSLKTPFILKR
jgi:hypothetical protein